MRMVRRAFGRAFDDAELEDIYSNAWLGTLRALNRRHASLSDEEIRKYVFTAVAHQAGKELRRRGRRPTAPLEAVGEVADLGPAPEDQAASGDERQLARDLLASLPPRRRAVMLLRYGCGLEPSQVCALVSNLSPRAYRKEITRGVDELTEKLRLVEAGDWCAEREPLMKAFAAGIASEEEARQARHHLSRCRDCSELVGRLSGHLHDLGGMLTMPAALEGVANDESIHDRLIAIGDRVRDALPGPLGGPDGDGLAAAAAGARGGGAAGAGLLTKLAGAGLGGKLAVACLAGGAVASTCAATGVLPTLSVPGIGETTKRVASTQRAVRPSAHDRRGGDLARTSRIVTSAPVVASTATTSAPAPDRKPATVDHDASAEVATTRASTTTTTPIVPSTPPVQQQFGVPAAASSNSTGGGGGGAGGGTTSGGSPAQQEFGP